MTIVRPLPDGTVVEFDDDTPEDEITAALRAYVRSRRAEMAQEHRARTEASGGGVVAAPQGDQRTQRPATGAAEAVSQDSSPVPAEPEPVVPNLRLVTVMPYVAAEHEPTPEQAREVAQRLGRPARREPPDEYSADDRFRDNMHHRWSRMYWRP